MKHLENIEEVGKGIAVAFVATVYGVGSSNLFFLPAGNKIRARLHETVRARELVLEGVIGIVEGLNPKLIRSKLDAYIRHTAPKKDGKPKKAPAPAGAPSAAKS
jgi:chemotaxis protein MotA